MITSIPIIITVYLGILFTMLAAGMWIGVGVGGVGLAGMGLLLKGSGLHLFAQIVYNQLHSFILTALPLFVFLGEILLRTGIGGRMYTALTGLFERIPGGLLHVNVASSAMLAAACGSSMATAATITTVAIPELEQRGYKKQWSLSSLVVSGSLGIMIPPSIPLIVYGFLTETSVVRLFTAGIIPGVLLAFSFSLLIFIQALRNPESIGGTQVKVPLTKVIKNLAGIIPVVILIVIVLGSIYGGIATPTESAGLGCVGALIVAAAYRKLTWRSLVDSLKETAILMGMIGFIIIGALAMSFSISHLGVGTRIMEFVGSLAIPPIAIIFMIYTIYIILGCVMDALALLLVIVPIAFPIVIGLGFDPVWFGIAVVIGQEMACITPPIGVNLWVVQGITGEPMERLSMWILPFFLILLAFLVVLTFFPQIATWLPDLIL